MVYRLARFLQLIGLVMLPVAIGLQLQEMPLKMMLMMSGVGVGLFYLGYLLQEWAKR